MGSSWPGGVFGTCDHEEEERRHLAAMWERSAGEQSGPDKFAETGGDPGRLGLVGSVSIVV